KLSEQNKQLKSQVEALKVQNEFIVRRVENLENRSRRNNLIFRGLKYECATADYARIVRDFCVSHVGARAETWVNRAHALGKKIDNGPIIAQFPDDQDIQFITRNSRKLKGTRFVIHKDFAFDTRKRRSKLFRVFGELKKRVPGVRVSVELDRLIVNGQVFTLDGENGLVSKGEDGLRKIGNMFDENVMQAVRRSMCGEETEQERGGEGEVGQEQFQILDHCHH
ncbi:hypothetical protein LSTR_LSTR017691, partial [Laodelphax striatellus]